MRRVYKNLCHPTISASIMVANMWKYSLKNVESDKNKILYEILLDFLQRNGTYFLNNPRICHFTDALPMFFSTCKRQSSTSKYKTTGKIIIIIIIYLLPAIGWSPSGSSQLHFVHVIQFHGLPTVPLFTVGGLHGKQVEATWK